MVGPCSKMRSPSNGLRKRAGPTGWESPAEPVNWRGAILLGYQCPPIPFFLHVPGGFRTVQAAIFALWFVRVVEIARAPWRFGRGERVARLLTVVETRQTKRVGRSAPVAPLLFGAMLLGVGIAVVNFGARLSPPVRPYAVEGWPRWLVATFGAYLLIEGTAKTMTALLPAFGWEHEPPQRSPLLSRTLAEFWGARWNRIVSFWLRANVFSPVARRGAPRLGIFLAFLVSALLHLFMVFPAAGLVPALWMGAFFLAHGILVTLEQLLGARRWPRICPCSSPSERPSRRLPSRCSAASAFDPRGQRDPGHALARATRLSPGRFRPEGNWTLASSRFLLRDGRGPR